MPPVILSDLDDTLFDHTRATRTALEVVRAATPGLAPLSIDDLHHRHAEILELLHVEVVVGRLAIDDARIERFRRLLVAAGADRAAITRLTRPVATGGNTASPPNPSPAPSSS